MESSSHFLLLFLVPVWVRADCLFAINGTTEPELSSSYLNGYWYEDLRVNDYLNNESCSFFQIECFNRTVCSIENRIWTTKYLVKTLWAGTLIQNETQVTFTVNDTHTQYDHIRFRYHENSVMIWECDNNTKIVFAFVLQRMNSDDELEETWNGVAKDFSVLKIIDGTPVGLWTKNDPSECTAGAAHMHFTTVFILSTLSHILCKLY